MTQPQDKMRADFRAWARLHESGINLTPEGAGYRYLLAQTYWEAWQAACAQQSAQSQQDALDARLYRHLRGYAAMSYPSCEKEAYLVVTGYGNVADPAIIDSAVKYEIATQGASNV